MKPTNAGDDDGNRSEPAAVPLAATQQHDELVTLAARSRGHQATLPDLELGPRGSGTLSLSQVIQLPQVLDAVDDHGAG